MKHIKYWYNTAWNYIQFWFAKREAIAKHKTDGKRYHVLPKSEGGFAVVNNDFINWHNKIVKQKKDKLDIVKLTNMSYFSTPVQGLSRGL